MAASILQRRLGSNVLKGIHPRRSVRLYPLCRIAVNLNYIIVAAPDYRMFSFLIFEFDPVRQNQSSVETFGKV